MTFLLEIITPEKISFSEDVEMVTVPGADGILGILPHHTPILARLVEGEVIIRKKGDDLYLAIGSGFLEVTSCKVNLLVTSAFHADEINETEVRAAQKRAKEALLNKPTGEALQEAIALYKRSVIALELLNRRQRGLARPS